MNILCSPNGIADAVRPGQGVSDIAGAGFQNAVLDMSIACTCKELENLEKKRKVSAGRDRIKVYENPELLESSLKPFLNKCRERQLTTSVARAPYLKRNARAEELNGLIVRLTEEAVKTAGKSGCQYIIIRPLFVGLNGDREWKVNREYYLKLADIAGEYNLMILLENQCKDVNGHLVRGICADGTEAAKWVDSLNQEVGEERFGFCMDVGACNLCGQNMYDFAVLLGSRIKAVILRDCNGDKENYLLPFSCANRGQSQTDWLNLIRGLRKIAFDGQLIMDFGDTAEAFSPILRPQLMQLAKATADYFKWQIEIEALLRKYEKRVLFGAGNMCRNYMKCYGEQYPPLYTCDNNKAVWGTEFCGLEVKSPDSLKELPEDCAVFICNIYYREIEQQLRSMGVQNPIEFFNDEYLSTFYFDRLEDKQK